jgi:hypothetical protein
MYFVIRNLESGAITINSYSKNGVNKLINNESDGDFDTHDFIKNITDDNPAYWGENSILIIKGEIVVPNPVRVIEQYKID